MADLHTLVQRMVEGGESEADIASVIQHYGAPQKPVSAEDFTQSTQPQGSAVGRFLSNAGEMLNPLTLIKGVAGAVAHPLDTLSNIGAAQWDQAKQAAALAGQGRISEAIGHGAAAAIPLLGPAAAAAGEQIGSGDIAGGLGKAAGLLAPAAIGALAPESASVPGLASTNPVTADAVELAQRSGVPLDAATATDNRFVRAIQHTADRSVGGALASGKVAQAQSDGLATLGEQLASKGYATPVTADEAGQAARNAVLEQVKIHSSDATDAYDALRKIEADPGKARPVVQLDGSTQLMPLPVDLRPARAALQPLYQDLSRQAELTPAALMGAKAGALNALDKLMNGPTHAPLSVVDGVLSDLKGFARADVPELRTAGQGAAAGAVRQLDAAVRQTAESAGPQAVNALKMGRGATIAKYGAADVLDSLGENPATMVSKLTSPAGIGQLRDVAAQAPGAIPQIGRAVLDDLLGKATADGDFGHVDAIAAKWQKLTPETKSILYQDPGYAKDLDSFFALAKVMGKNANPSGTAHTLIAATQGGLMLTNPIAGGATALAGGVISKLLHSPSGVKLLTRGLRIPVANKAAGAAWLTDLAAATSPSGSQTPVGQALAPAR